MVEYGLIAFKSAVETIGPIVQVLKGNQMILALLGICFLVFIIYILRKQELKLKRRLGGRL